MTIQMKEVKFSFEDAPDLSVEFNRNSTEIERCDLTFEISGVESRLKIEDFRTLCAVIFTSDSIKCNVEVAPLTVFLLLPKQGSSGFGAKIDIAQKTVQLGFKSRDYKSQEQISFATINQLNKELTSIL